MFGSSLVTLTLLISACRPASTSPIASLIEKHRAAVFVFVAPDCPLSQDVTGTFNELHTQFADADIEFYAVFSGKAAVEGARVFQQTYHVDFRDIPDGDLRLAKFLGATTTPEAVVVDGNGKALYSGAIDNRASELGERRFVITEHYLADALDSLQKGQDVRVKRTKAVGCFIEGA
jgi:thiol-disulfide isomerase/thioredoxin